MTTNQDFYCSQKFWWLSVDLEKRITASCCAATPSKIDLKWLENNPGKLFNGSLLVSEREDMLNNIPVNSCQDICWKPEALGLPSRRTLLSGNVRTHTDIIATPEFLNIIVGSHCNLTCVYCCKQYSTAWKKDIIDNGTYSDVIINDDRFVINDIDKILFNLGQKDISSSDSTHKLLTELKNICDNNSKLTEMSITGGEPFLYLKLSELVKSIPSRITVQIWSGLGVDPARLEKELIKIKDQNICIIISAESTEQQYEFIRHGNTWARLNENIKLLDKYGIKYEFGATITNLTLFGLKDFIMFAQDKKIKWSLCNDPDFLSVNVIDDYTRAHLLSIVPPDLHNIILTKDQIFPTTEQRINLKNYLIEFSKRRGLSLSIFPKSFVEWVLE